MPTRIYLEPTAEAGNDHPDDSLVRQTRAAATAAAAAAATTMDEEDIGSVDGDRIKKEEALPPPPSTRSSPRRNASKSIPDKVNEKNQNNGGRSGVDGDQEDTSNQDEEEQEEDRPNAGTKRKPKEEEDQPPPRAEARTTRTTAAAQTNKRRKTSKTSSSSSMPHTQRSLIGTRISKSFFSEIFGKEETFDGIVVSGPVKVLNKETKKMEESWRVQYTDGDKEDMNLEEIQKWSVDDLEDSEGEASSSLAAATATSASIVKTEDPPQKKVATATTTTTTAAAAATTEAAAAAAASSSAADGSGEDEKKKKESQGKRKRGYGPEENRTCPKCKRVYGSLSALKYHVSKKVCEPGNKKRKISEPKSKKDPKSSTKTAAPKADIIFHALEPGERFITKFGVVEVVKDDRAAPTATLPSGKDAKKKKEFYNQRHYKLIKKRERRHVAHGSIARARRSRINTVYETHRRQSIQDSYHNPIIDGRSIAKAYFPGTDSGTSLLSQFPPDSVLDLPDDPAGPPESFPDRIVECIGISDNRRHFEGVTNEPTSGTNSFVSKQPTKFFLQRRLLVDPYSEEQEAYCCVDCGSKYSTSSGLSYHERNDACANKIEKATRHRLELEKRIEDGADKILEESRKKEIKPDDVEDEDTQQIFIDRPKKEQATKTTRSERKAIWIKKKRELAVYPEILVSLGFTLRKKGRDADRIIQESKVLKKAATSSDKQMTNSSPVKREEKKDEPALEHPNDVFLGLQKEFEHQQRLEKSLIIGSLYTECFDSLGFKQFSSKPIKVSTRKKPARPSRGRTYEERFTERVEAVPVPLPVDVRAIFDEVDGGRYPSMKRYDNEHQKTCIGCKNIGETPLHECSFCKHVEHIGCMRERCLVKDPEPLEDFMCHICLQAVMARRNRAQKRVDRKVTARSDNQTNRSASPKKQKTDSGNKEHTILAKRGQEVSQLTELLGDARERLKQLMATQEINQMRQRMMDHGL